jgi:hypothetical protein
VIAGERACKTYRLSNHSPGAIGVPSIYQPRKTGPSREFAVFAGFFGVFLEIGIGADWDNFYILWFSVIVCRLEVAAVQIAVGDFRADNQGTTDGTEVLER